MLYMSKVNDIYSMLHSALFVWIGFILTTHFSGVLWTEKKLGTCLIDTGYFLACMMVIGLVKLMM
jgi:hypothetical protein